MSYWDFSFNHFELYSKEDFIISNSCLHFEVYNVFYYVYLDAVLTTLHHIPIIKKKINPHYLRPKPKSINFYLHFTQIQESSEATDFCMEEATTLHYKWLYLLVWMMRADWVLLPYGFIFELSQWPEGCTSFSVVIMWLFSMSALSSEFRNWPKRIQKVHLTLSLSVCVKVSFIFRSVNQSSASADPWV